MSMKKSDDQIIADLRARLAEREDWPREDQVEAARPRGSRVSQLAGYGKGWGAGQHDPSRPVGWQSGWSWREK